MYLCVDTSKTDMIPFESHNKIQSNVRHEIEASRHLCEHMIFFSPTFFACISFSFSVILSLWSPYPVLNKTERNSIALPGFFLYNVKRGDVIGIEANRIKTRKQTREKTTTYTHKYKHTHEYRRKSNEKNRFSREKKGKNGF